ncbi:hypothetical protein AMAG_00076 [Allomyces macrogynus ATCC 38327]|uniref:Uncharacterized protein n=1 Tax=Allomyces macrogynus (strain ATCC 38327) TaxID=578462 RepID=A0A0L0RVH2_ALLM3|nr:hypothetical protein AMAG_00076 [Allomyces macrogynus ATCC 38327]|eukprot:KNE54075.1 hypothetical protein AMAG_00076 [Allomyces macrogynus ATCC 38327]
MTLADVTSADLSDVIKALRKSPGTKPTGSVMINSYNGNTYGGVDIQLSVKGTKGTPTLVSEPVNPFCQKSVGRH